MNELLREIYYDPETGLQGVQSLYQKAKQKIIEENLNPTIKRKDVDAWLKRQEVAQVHAPRKEVTHYYPIKSNELDHIWQADLADFSAQAHNNHGVNFLLCVIDIWSRYVWVRALRNKESKTVNAAMADILSEGRTPQILMSDSGSEFISKSFRKLMTGDTIAQAFAEPGDHHRMGIIERFNKTIRGAITKYMTAFKTKSYIGVLDKLVKNYNNTVHSSIGATPADASFNPSKYTEIINAKIKDKEDRARGELSTFEIGDEVRSLKNKVMFEKGAIPKYSQSVHKVTGHLAGKRYMLDNGKSYLYYQLKKLPLGVSSRIGQVEEAPEENPVEEQKEKEIIEPKPIRLALKKEGVEKKNIREGLRERKPAVGLQSKYGERINW